MQEQAFEDEVRRKMEELSFSPSAPVWTGVEAQIRKKDKRRRLLLLWLFPLLLAGGFAIYITQVNTEASMQTTSSIAVTSKHSSLPITNKKVVEKEQKGKQSNREEIVVSNSTQTIKIAISSKKKNVRETTTVALSEQSSVTKAKSKFASPKEKLSSGNIIEELEAKTNNGQSEAASTTVTEAASTLPSLPASIDTANKQTVAIITDNKASIDSIATPLKQATSTPKKWNWSLLANAGISNLKQNLFNENVPFANSGPLTSSPPPPTANTPPALRRSIAFSTGASVDRSLSNRIKFSAGLQYAYFSTRLRIGQKVSRDTSIITGGFATSRQNINSYYTPGNREDYTSKYHFIQVPIGIEWKVFKALPLSLNLGASFSQLLTTNHLERSANGTLYYKSADKLTRTQVYLFGGLNYRIWRSTKHTMHIGPYLQYGLTPLQKNPNKRLTFTGIQTKISF